MHSLDESSKYVDAVHRARTIPCIAWRILSAREGPLLLSGFLKTTWQWAESKAFCRAWVGRRRVLDSFFLLRVMGSFKKSLFIAGFSVLFRTMSQTSHPLTTLLFSYFMQDEVNPDRRPASMLPDTRLLSMLELHVNCLTQEGRLNNQNTSLPMVYIMDSCEHYSGDSCYTNTFLLTGMCAMDSEGLEDNWHIL